MGVELTMLAYSAALLFVLVVLQAVVGIRAQGLVPLANARDDLPPPGVLQARVKRVVDNHREGLTIMAPLLLIAVVAQSTNATTALGAQLFFYSRVVHAGLYLFGVPMVRPLAWAVGVTGTVMVFAVLMGWA
ncbi:MAPEG family protein [Phenylobacterium aquaticum]|uniref:MAPEG family protein n=1 Tax=Phenylobacterium aquaticum TaxID=1763816 RepID=UPI0026F1BCA1|nr:MAPEG family protein [Phenylobacterium aquaticum]